MASFRNRAHLEGNIGKDAVLKTTPSGDVVNFSVAVNETWTDKSNNRRTDTAWFQVQVWGALTKFAATLTAGTPVIVEGKMKPETYTADGVTHRTFSIRADYIRKISYTMAQDDQDQDEQDDQQNQDAEPVSQTPAAKPNRKK
jgi:single-strand DNA-binding protein